MNDSKTVNLGVENFANGKIRKMFTFREHKLL